MDDVLSNLWKPDNVIEWAIRATFGPGVILALFAIGNFVISWYPVLRGALRTPAAVAGAVRATRTRLHTMSATQRSVAFGVSCILVMAQALWLVSALVIGNLIYFAYAGSGDYFLALEVQDAQSVVGWFDWHPFPQLYVAASVIALVYSYVRRLEPDVNQLALVVNIPAVIWGALVGLLLAFELVLGGLEWLGTGKAETLDAATAWHAVFAATIAIYLLACRAALRSAVLVRRLWRGGTV